MQCPEGFVQQATDCIAPSDYTGPCNRHQPELYLLSNTAKRSWSWACKAKYPCMPEQCPTGTDYSDPCPIGWYTGTNGECATADAASQCDERITASAYRAAKSNWERVCGVRWPCTKIVCVKDFSVNCPVDWADAGSGVCNAPSTYQGPCSKRVDLAAYRGRSDLKRAFETRCGVSWVCMNGTRERKRDFTVPCPLGWTLFEDNSCGAPPSYTSAENCPRRVSFIGRTPEDRQAFAAMCNVDFPFLGKQSTCVDSKFAQTCRTVKRKRLL